VICSSLVIILSFIQQRHCEERSDDAIHRWLDCFASLAMTVIGISPYR